MPTRILIVEDTADIREVLVITLAEEGYEVEAAADATEAYSLLESFTPDVVLLDLHLPDISGLEILKKLRQTLTVPILMFTSSGDSAAVRKAIDAGATDYVLKGTGLEKLVDRIKKHLKAPSTDAAAATPVSNASSLIYVGSDVNVERLVSDSARRLDVNAAKVTEGKLALAGLKTHKPAVLVIELRLPDMNGLDLVKTIRGNQAMSRIGLVMVADKGSPEIKRSALRHGAASIFTKPVSDMDFEQAIRKLVTASRAKRAS